MEWSCKCGHFQGYFIVLCFCLMSRCVLFCFTLDLFNISLQLYIYIYLCIVFLFKYVLFYLVVFLCPEHFYILTCCTCLLKKLHQRELHFNFVVCYTMTIKAILFYSILKHQGNSTFQ